MASDNKQTIVHFLIALALALGFVFLAYYAQVNEAAVINSDNAFPVLAGQAIFSGNPLLEGWIASTRSFYFDSYVYGIAGQFFGYDFRLVYKVSAIVIGIFFAYLCYVIMQLSVIWKRGRRVANLLFAISLCIASIYMASNSTQSNWAASHVFAAITGLMLVWNLYFTQKKGRLLSAGLLLSLALIVLTMGDYLLLYFAILPSAAVLLCKAIKTRKADERRRDLLHLLFLAIAVIANRLLISSLEYFGGMPPAFSLDSVGIISAEQVPARFFYAVECFLTMFNGDFFGKTVTFGNVSYFLAGAIFIFLMACLILCAKKVLTNFLTITCLVSIIFTTLVLTLTTFAHSSEALWDTRLMYYAFYSTVILFSRIDWSSIFERLGLSASSRRDLILVVLIALLFTACGLSKIDHTNRSEYENATPFKIAGLLEKHNLREGYGTFWLSDVITLASNNKVEVCSIVGPKIEVFHWLAAPVDSITSPNFVLIDDTEWGHITHETVLSTFGNPVETYQEENVTVMVYDENLRPYMKGYGYRDGSRVGWLDFGDGNNTRTVAATSSVFDSSFDRGSDGFFVSDAPGFLIYGPYDSIEAGSYRLTFNCCYDGNAEPDEVIGKIDVYSDSRKYTYAETDVVAHSERCFSVTLNDIEIPEDVDDIETRLYASVPGIKVTDVTIQKISR